MHNKKQQQRKVLQCFQIPLNDGIKIKASVLKTHELNGKRLPKSNQEA
jgi:hypothetical protein